MSRWIAMAVVLLTAVPVPAHAQAGPAFLKTLRTRATFDALAERKTQTVGQRAAELKFLISKVHMKTPVCRFFDSKLYPSHYALDVEFKIDSAGKLVFKQARPWVE